jgi:hypothetical protein
MLCGAPRACYVVLHYATYAVEHVGAGSITDPSGTIVMNRDWIK